MSTRFEGESNPGRKQMEMGAALEKDADFEFDQAMKDFRASVHAWSDAAYGRPRTAALPARSRGWRPALGWALGGLLAACGASGGLVERHRLHEQARVAAEQRAAAQDRQLLPSQAPGVPDEVLLAGVDSDVSRQVPSAMEPLAQMMSDDETK